MRGNVPAGTLLSSEARAVAWRPAHDRACCRSARFLSAQTFRPGFRLRALIAERPIDVGQPFALLDLSRVLVDLHDSPSVAANTG